MTFNEFLKDMKVNFSKIKDENILFWNLWCLNFAYDKIGSSYKHYDAIKNANRQLWEINDLKKQFNETNDFNMIQNFDDEEFENLNDFEIEELAIKEFINSADIIIRGLKNKENHFGGQAVYSMPFTIIDVILDQDNLSITKDNGFENIICKNEANAQLKLSDLLSTEIVNYTFTDRNIFRTP